MVLKNFIGAAAMATAATIAGTADAADVDLVFVIDRSGSMGSEYDGLAETMGTVFEGLTDVEGLSSLNAGLVTYGGRNGQVRLEQDLTDDGAALGDAVAGVRNRYKIEKGLSALDDVIDGTAGLGFRDGAMRSVVLITDEDSDDSGSYGYGGMTGYAALGQRFVDQNAFLSVVTRETLFDSYGHAVRAAGDADPARAMFDIAEFSADPQTFLAGFAADMAAGIAASDTRVTPTPIPATAVLLGCAVGGLGWVSRRRRG